MVEEDRRRPINLEAIREKTEEKFVEESRDSRERAGEYFRDRMRVFLEVYAGELPEEIKFNHIQIGWRGQLSEQEYTLNTKTGNLRVPDGEVSRYGWFYAREAIISSVRNALKPNEESLTPTS